PVLQLGEIEAVRKNVRTAGAGRIPTAGLRNDSVTIATFAHGAHRTDEPVVRAWRAGDFKVIRFGIPNRAVGPFPSVATARFACVLRVEVMTVDRNFIPNGGGGPAVMRPGFRVGAVAET